MSGSSIVRVLCSASLLVSFAAGNPALAPSSVSPNATSTSCTEAVTSGAASFASASTSVTGITTSVTSTITSTRSEFTTITEGFSTDLVSSISLPAVSTPIVCISNSSSASCAAASTKTITSGPKTTTITVENESTSPVSTALSSGLAGVSTALAGVTSLAQAHSTTAIASSDVSSNVTGSPLTFSGLSPGQGGVNTSASVVYATGFTGVGTGSAGPTANGTLAALTPTQSPYNEASGSNVKTSVAAFVFVAISAMLLL